MKIARLLIPAYFPAPYPGATPTPYLSSMVDNFERKLVELSPLVVRQPNATRLGKDEAGRFVHPHIVVPYDIWGTVEEIGAVIELALKTFTLESVIVIFNGNAEPMNAAAVEELAQGLHIWCDE